MRICFATNNQNKLKEIRNLLSDKFEVLSLKEINCFEELPENQNTLEGNSLEKAAHVYDRFGVNCFADDTGLEVEALNGEPGVYSARYAGEQRDNQANMDLLLQNLEDKSNRKAKFRTVITLILDGKKTQFEGVVDGSIVNDKRGAQGFGYDPIFVPNGHNRTFAEMDLTEKNKMSHRAKAIQKLIAHLNQL
ncbi:non-canonical purine NTP diphosphatase [Fulvivirgaceae bacterium BMA10]|uniref:dITP/XTP pyrophosphatase n=1 Tax=Splendidivirga corallicola TaxID=3051826 RepID=A0ABT8KMR2_9BACT|nr:non-canonical purine NTP diphosphatase [Fulvivirgaceae bacterium BMA10]